jgi:predicted amidohydrolase
MALKYPGVIVGIKSAHFTGPEWKPYEQAEIAGKMANIPVMIDFGARRIERPIYKLFADYLRPGDIYTHALSGERGEQDNVTGGVGRGLRGFILMWGTGRRVLPGQWQSRCCWMGFRRIRSRPICTWIA